MEEFENEVESTESGASESPSPEGSESSSEGGEAAAQTAAAPKQESEIDWSKAFEHPRFKELIGQKNEWQSKYQESDSRYKALEQQLNSLKESQPKSPTEFDQLIQDLKKVDPRLAGALETQALAAKQAQALQARLDAFERNSQESARQSQVQTAVSRINQMHEQNKVEPEIRQFINDKLDVLHMQGKLNLQNLEQAYKEKFDEIKKFQDAFSRKITESYVQAKKKDGAIPTSQPKGAAPKAGAQKQTPFKDKDSLRAAVVKDFMTAQAAEKAAESA